MTLKTAERRREQNAPSNANIKRRKRMRKRIILSVSGEGLLHSWVTLQIPAWIMAAVLAFFVVMLIAVAASPEIAARCALALIQLASLLSGFGK